MRPLRVALNLRWCDHDYPRCGWHTLCHGQIKAPVLVAPASLIGSEPPAQVRSGPSLCSAPMPQCQPALTFAQWGTPPEGPPFPSRLLSKHISYANKMPICSTSEGCRRVTVRYNFVEPGLPISPPPRRPGVSIACAPFRCRRGCLMYTRSTSLPNLYIRNIIPDDMGNPLVGVPGPSGWGYAPFHTGAQAMRTMPYQSFSDVGLVLLRRVCCFLFFLYYLQTFDLLECEAHYAAVLALVLEVDGLLVVVDHDLRGNPAAVVEPVGRLGDVFVHYLLSLRAHARLHRSSIVFVLPRRGPIYSTGGSKLSQMLSRRGPRYGTGATAEPGLIVRLEAVLQAWLRTSPWRSCKKFAPKHGQSWHIS